MEAEIKAITTDKGLLNAQNVQKLIYQPLADVPLMFDEEEELKLEEKENQQRTSIIEKYPYVFDVLGRDKFNWGPIFERDGGLVGMNM
ncbi:MAG: hypothetical protein EZS28_018972 [Streblomastix strix]|uniref:Uncharacterized protein n=1 Tax=Streblomastix strix TaxID=222440 RepID=A0A5J4VSV8_9EUKA|nr:MAG: hypothetical protein EZS28_018972 [Streblomastix strix]